MWFERFVIIVTSMHRDFLPSSWTYYSPTYVEISIFLGTIGIFLTAFLLFAKFLPVVAIHEVKTILKISGESYKKKRAQEELAHNLEHGGIATPAFQANQLKP